jgi:archaemetzincin
MKENLFDNLEEILAPLGREYSNSAYSGSPKSQSFRDYRRSQPARRTARRQAIYLSRIGRLSADQEALVAATAEYLALFFELPVREGACFNPETFAPRGIRKHPTKGHPQILTGYINDEVLWLDRPEEALICLAVTFWDLCSDEYSGGRWGSVFGEAIYGHGAVWSMRFLGNPGGTEGGFGRCLKRNCAVAAHEALHVLGMDHCTEAPCNMKGSACLSGPLHLCPTCLRKLSWNRQLDLLSYLQRVRDWLVGRQFLDAAEHYETMLQLLDRRGWRSARPNRKDHERRTGAD